MAFVLKDGVYSVRCRHAQCNFNSRFHIDAVIMGATEADVESQASAMARSMGMVKHDSLHGRAHPLENPEVRKVSGYLHQLLATTA